MKDIAFKSFYDRPEWKELRYRVLRKYGFACQACGQKGTPTRPVHVDHVKPKAIYPELALTPENLQVLCADCNLGKSAHFEDDFRRSRIEGRKRKPVAPERARPRKVARISAEIIRRLSRAESMGDEHGIRKHMWRYFRVARILRKKAAA